MRRRLFLTLTATVALTAASTIELHAEDKQLTGAEIETLLVGNTISGTWGEADYKQYYGENEFTMYVPEGGQPDQGKWRANHDTNQYESWWESTGWKPYTLVQTDTGYAWVNGDKLEPFEVLEGKQVSW